MPQMIIPIKHLPGQHDQSSHGSWARGSGSVDERFTKAFPGTEVNSVKYFPTFEEWVSLGGNLDSIRKPTGAEIQTAKELLLEAKALVLAAGITPPPIKDYDLYYFPGSGGVASAQRGESRDKDGVVLEYVSKISLNMAEINSDRTKRNRRYGSEGVAEGRPQNQGNRTAASALVHEMGHTLHHPLQNEGAMLWDLWEDNYEESASFSPEFVSRYGEFNHKEHFAEWVTAIVYDWDGLSERKETNSYAMMSLALNLDLDDIEWGHQTRS